MILSPANTWLAKCARDGRMVLQVRIELGVLQLEVGGHPTAYAHMALSPTSITSAIAPPAEDWHQAASRPPG